MYKCKPGVSAKDFWNAIGPFMSKKNKTQRNIILKEGDSVITNISELCEIFANCFSTVANSIGSPDQIDMSKSDFLYDTIEKHTNHNSIKAILEQHKCNETFEFKQIDIDYVYKLLCKLNIHKAMAYDNVPPKMVKICAVELSVTLTEFVNYAFKKSRFPDDMKRAEIFPI